MRLPPIWKVKTSPLFFNLPNFNVLVGNNLILPLNRFLATAVWDNSWRLWDLEQLTEVTFPASLPIKETLLRCCIKRVIARRCTLLPFKMMELLPALEVNLNHLH